MIDFNYTILVQFANFLILLVLLNFLLFKPVLRAINKREEAINSSLEKGQVTSDEAKKLEKLYEEGTKEKKKPILETKDSMLTNARDTSVKILERARAELSSELARIKSEISEESQKVSDTLKMDVEKFSRDVAEKILKRGLA